MANATMSPVPGYLLGAAMMTPLQRMTRVATEGVAGGDSRFRSMEAGKYLRDLLAEKLIGDDGKIMEKVVIPRIMEQYANEVLGSPVEHPGKGFSIMKAYNQWYDKVKDPDSPVKDTDPPLTKDGRVFEPPGGPGDGDAGNFGGYGGVPDTGVYSGMQGILSGQVPSKQNMAMAAFANTNPVTGLMSTIAELTSKYGSRIGTDNLDPHPNIATNALGFDDGLVDAQGQTSGGDIGGSIGTGDIGDHGLGGVEGEGMSADGEYS